MTIPAGQIGNEQPLQVVTETWYSPELQTVVLRKRSDPRSGDTVTRYMNVSRTEPPRTMFEPPADFKISETGHPQWQRQQNSERKAIGSRWRDPAADRSSEF